VSISLVIFFGFVASTLGITYWASKRSRSGSAYFAAGRRITAWQNGFAVAGDFMSAASFLGVVGLIAIQGFDGFLYALGGFVAFVTILLLVAEPLRNTGKYTLGDVLAYRLRPRPVRALAALSTLATILFYMTAQMVGAGALVTLLLAKSGIGYNLAVTGVGILMMVYVVFGGMLATTWVQIIKAVLLLTCAIALTIFVLGHFHFRFTGLFTAASQVAFHQNGQAVIKDFLQPGLRYQSPRGPLEWISLSMVFVLGTAGLPHILVKFYTVPDAKTARKSVVWTMLLIGTFYVLTSVLGLGAAVILGPDYIVNHGGTNMTVPLLAQALAGDLFLAVVSAVAFATILAVVAGLMISASTSFAHDFWMNVIHHGVERKPGETVLVARIAALAVGAVAIVIAIALGPASNAVILATFGMAVAASANFPVIALSIFWRRFNTAGAVAGLSVGLLVSIGLILASPNFMGIDSSGATGVHHLIQLKAWFPLENVGIVSVPLGFLAAIVGTLLSLEPTAEAKFNEFVVRANTGLGAEKASAQ
jgi:cation/acetate symporter